MAFHGIHKHFTNNDLSWDTVQKQQHTCNSRDWHAIEQQNVIFKSVTFLVTSLLSIRPASGTCWNKLEVSNPPSHGTLHCHKRASADPIPIYISYAFFFSAILCCPIWNCKHMIYFFLQVDATFVKWQDGGQIRRLDQKFGTVGRYGSNRRVQIDFDHLGFLNV